MSCGENCKCSRQEEAKEAQPRKVATLPQRKAAWQQRCYTRGKCCGEGKCDRQKGEQCCKDSGEEKVCKGTLAISAFARVVHGLTNNKRLKTID